MLDRGLLMGVILRSPPLTRDPSRVKGATLRAGSESLRWADGETLRAILEIAALRVTLLFPTPEAGTADSRLRMTDVVPGRR